MTLERVYTLDEAAEALRMTRRGIIKVAKRHGLCMVNGRHITFTATQLVGIQDAMTWAAEPDPGVAHVKGKLATSDNHSGSASPKLRELLIQRSNRPWARKLRAERESEK